MLGGDQVSFEDDLEPLLDGYAVMGLTQRPVPPLPEDIQALRRKAPEDLTPAEENRVFEAQDRLDAAAEPLMVLVYRTEGDGLREVVEKIAGEEELKPVAGHEDAVAIDKSRSSATTRSSSPRGDDGDRARGPRPGRRGRRGFPAARLADAEKATGLDDPFVLAPATARWRAPPSTSPACSARSTRCPGSPRSARWQAPSGSTRTAPTSPARIATDPRGLTAEDLPLAPAGELELPRNDLLTGASRDQSFTTTFLSKAARALFADSDFAKAVERAERDLGVSFEDEVLRQFSCPSMSQLDTADNRFGARSCVTDPERMRELLPKLSEHLPRILTSMQRLDAQGLVGLLLIAPTRRSRRRSPTSRQSSSSRSQAAEATRRRRSTGSRASATTGGTSSRGAHRTRSCSA